MMLMILGHAIYIYRYFHKNLDILIKYEYNRVKFLLILIYQTKHTKKFRSNIRLLKTPSTTLLRDNKTKKGVYFRDEILKNL